MTGGGRDDHDRAIAETSVVDAPGPGESGDPGDALPGRPAIRAAPRQVGSGDRLGRYELGEELGEGGMATVFRARDRELRRDVAVKVLFPHLARRVEIVRRFQREARAAAALEHPNILRIYDVGGDVAGDPPYIVMELVRGRTLLQEVEQRGALLAEVVACIGALLGDALAAAHAAGVIHRDVKPGNVLIAPGGRLLLADFGVARLETEDSLVTRTGALLGTPAYMSPEQASGDVATAQSDLYSLGATLYQLATGALPYSGPPAKVMSMIVAGNRVAPVRRRPACGQELSRLIERSMASDPAARPATAAAMASELRAVAADRGFGDAGDELAAYFGDPDGFLVARTPVVVTALVTAAQAAIAEARLPHAMALADRASALAPADPAVTELVRAVTQGGHLARRKRMLAIAGAVLAVAGGAIAAAAQLRGAPAAGDHRELGMTAPASTGQPAPRAERTPDQGAATAPEPASTSPPGDAVGPARDPELAMLGTAPAAARPPDAPVPGDARAATRSASDRAAAPPARAPSSASSRAAVIAAAPGDRAAAHGTSPAPDAADGEPTPRAAEVQTPVATPGAPRAVALRAPVSSSVDGRGAAPPGTAERPAAPIVPPASAAAVTAGPALRDHGSAGTATGDAAGGDKPAGASATGGPSAPSGAGRVIVHNDVWCDISIDGRPVGNRRNEPLEVGAGRHTVRCVNPAGEWTQTVEVAAGTTQKVSGSVLKEFAVTLEIDATIDGRVYPRGAVVKLKPGNIEVIADGKKQFITFRASCRLRNTPALGCYL